MHVVKKEYVSKPFGGGGVGGVVQKCKGDKIRIGCLNPTFVGPKSRQKCYITPAFPGIPNKGDKSKRAQKRAEMLHHPYILRVPQTKGKKSELAA